MWSSSVCSQELPLPSHWHASTLRLPQGMSPQLHHLRALHPQQCTVSCLRETCRDADGTDSSGTWAGMCAWSSFYKWLRGDTWSGNWGGDTSKFSSLRSFVVKMFHLAIKPNTSILKEHVGRDPLSQTNVHRHWEHIHGNHVRVWGPQAHACDHRCLLSFV